jgi:GDP-L-fucose synthase
VKIYIAGIRGMVGSAIAREALSRGAEVVGKPSTALNLTNRESVFKELAKESPDVLVIAAARVGGIGANSKHPVEFLSENLQIQTNLMDAANSAGIARVLFLGSSCVYPKLATQPMREDALLTGPLEPTNESYALAKIAGLKLINAYRHQYDRNWISVMPTNLYGPGDNFDLNTGHALAAMIHRFHKAKIEKSESVTIWGDGSPLREYLHVQDLAEVCLLLLDSYNGEVALNLGSSEEMSIIDLARMIKKITNFSGDILLDLEKPNGTPRKLLDSTAINQLGWHPRISLEKGLEETYRWFLSNKVRA